jgi:phosphoadenosine phosphosulfate reductase
MGIVRLGELHLRWCRQCNVPVLESTECGSCHGRTEPVSITPPGDVRPAFAHDIDFMRSLAERDFGPGCGNALLPEGRIVLLNKVPGLDRMEEIIVDGTVVAAARYDIGFGWKIILRVSAARMLQDVATKGVIVADDGAVAPIQKSSSLMVPGVVSAVSGISKGDEVIVVDSRHFAFATGTAKMSTEEMSLLEKGAAVKTRWADLPAEHVPRKDVQDWDMVIKANSPVMERRIWDAIKFIRETTAELKLPAIVSFSGGKDSLATMLLTRDAGLDLPSFFIDTGLEFPETVQYVNEIAEHYHLKLIVEHAPEHAFFGNLNYFGPPGRDFRWCCKTNKLGPTVKAIMEHFPDGVLSFIGQRKYESEQRADKPRVWRNPWTPGQVGASPIQHWTALHVWIYIFMRKAPFNPWYEHGLDRIGCFLCPASDLAELELVKSESDRSKEWDAYLHKYAESIGQPKEWVELGLWRWKRVPASVKEELARTGIIIPERQRKELEETASRLLTLRMQDGFSPCVLGFSIEGAFSRKLDLLRAANLLNMVGDVTTNEEEGWCSIEGVTLFDEGALIAKGKDQKAIREKVERVRRAVVKAEECVGCGVCIARCKEGALRLEQDRVLVISLKCIHCGGCMEPCPAVSFGDTTFDF